MADEVARTALVYDASGAKKGAEEFAAASQKVIAADKAVGTSQTTTAQTVDAATKRVATSMRDQERFLAQAARRYDPFGQEVRKAANELARLEGIANSAGPNAGKAADMLAGAQKRLQQAEQALAQSRQQAGQVQQQEMAKTSAGYDRILGIARQLVPVLSAVYAVDKLKDMVGNIARAGSEWQNMAARAGAAGLSMEAIYQSAQRTGTALNDNVAAIARIGMAAKDIGATGAEIARVNETVTKLGRVSGASAQEAAAGMQQLAQALASGRLNGDELRSIMENMPAVARQIAEGLGVSVGTLRDMGAAGQLTADKVFGALLSGSAAADAAFARMPVTLEQAGTRMQNSFVRVGAAIDNSTGLSRLLARGMESVSQTVDELARRIEGDLTQRIKDLRAELDRLKTAGPSGPANDNLAPLNDPNYESPLARQMRNIRARRAQPVQADLSAALELNAAMEMEAGFARMAESSAATLAAANKKVTDGLNEMFKSLGFVVENGKLMTSEQVALARATEAVNKAVEQGGGFLQRLGISADGAKAMLEQLRQKLDPLQKAMRDMRNEADLLATSAGFERNLERRIQQFRSDYNRDPLPEERQTLARGVQDVGIAGTIDAAEQARRQAVAQERLAGAAGKGSAAMREAERVNALVARGYEVLTEAQAKQLESTGKIPQTVDGAAVSLTEYNRQLAKGNAAKAAQEAREFGSGASAAAKGAMLMAEAAGLGEAAQRAAAAQAAILAEKNFSGAEAARQRVLEEAKVVELTNTAVRGYERSAEANDAMAAAILRGSAAVAEQERAERQAQAVRELGANRQKEVAAVMAAYDTERESRLKRISAAETVALQQQAQGVQAMAAATAQGSAAVAEAAIQQDLLTRARGKGLDTVDAFVAKYPAEEKAVRDLAEANKQLAVQQALLSQRQDITQARAELALVKELPEVRTRELALIRAKLDIENRYPGILQEQRDEMLQNAQVLADINDQLRVQNEIRDAAKGIASDVSQFLVDGFVNVENKGNSVFKNIWDGAVAGGKRFLAKIAAMFLEQQIILPIAMSVVGGLPGLFGIRGASAGGGTSLIPNADGSFSLSSVGSGISLANTLSGGSLFSGVGDALGLTGLLGNGTGFLGLPGLGTAFSTIGGALGIGSGVATGTMAATTAAGSAAAAEIGAVAAGSALAPGLGASLAAVALPLAAVAIPLIAMSLFNKKPSNKGAEYSFMTDEDWTTQFEGNKHPDQMALVKSFAEPLQDAIVGMEDRFGVMRRADATIGTNFGLKEGSSFFYDRGERDGGIENRQVFSFDPNDQASIQAALDQLMVAFLKDADWSGIGTRIGAQAAADVATALENSAATTLDELLADISFAESFQSLVDLSSEALDPVALAMRAVANEGKALASSLSSNVDTFRQKAEQLGLGTEVLADGTTRVDAATQGYILTLLGIEAPLDGVAAATERANAFITDLVPILEAAGFSAERVGQITAQVFDNMVADAEAAAAEMRRAMTAAAIDIRTGIEQAINPSYQMSAASLFAAQGLDTTQYARLLGLVNAAATGDEAALRQVGDRLIYNLDPDNNPATAGYITQPQADAIRNYATSAYSRVVAPQSGGYQPANDNGSVTSSGGGSTANSAREAIQKNIDGLQELASVQSDAAREAERLANAFAGAADSLRLYRLGLLTDPTNNPASLGDQLAEAQRQQASALARVLAGGPDAPDAARELQQVSDTVLQLGRSVFGSSPQYVALFDRTIGMLTQAEGAAKTFEQQQLALQTAANNELKRLNDQIGLLRDQLSTSNSGTPGNPSNPGSPGSPGSPTTPAAGYYVNAQGVLTQVKFGRESLGRGANEDIAAYMPRMFKSYTGALTEDAAYTWMQQAHPSGLDGLSRLEYFAAARRAGYPMTLDFGAGTHTAWLNAVTDGARWMAFIDKLRDYATVPPGFFAAQGAPQGYALGGLVTGGTPGLDSVPAMLMPGERVFSVPHSRIIEGLAMRGGTNDNRELVVRLDRLIAENKMLNSRLARLEMGQERGNRTRDEMRSDAKSTAAAHAPKVGQPPIRTGRAA